MFKSHAYHWNVTGPLLHSPHKLTETQYEDPFAVADVITERIRVLGQLARMRLDEMAAWMLRSIIADWSKEPRPTSREAGSLSRSATCPSTIRRLGGALRFSTSGR